MAVQREAERQTGELGWLREEGMQHTPPQHTPQCSAMLCNLRDLFNLYMLYIPPGAAALPPKPLPRRAQLAGRRSIAAAACAACAAALPCGAGQPCFRSPARKEDGI